MPQPDIRPYDRFLAEPVAHLIAGAFAEHRVLPPLSYMAASPADMSSDALLTVLVGDDLRADLSFVAFEGGLPVAAAIARSRGDEVGWWRIATAPDHRRRGLAAACLSAGEQAARAAGIETLSTIETVDSRWDAAAALLRAAGYQLVDPSRRNISMSLDMTRWQERPVELPAGYEFATYSEEFLGGWTECRNQAFDSDAGPEWFVEHFVSRPDFDPTGWYLVLHEGRVVAISGALACRGQDGAVSGGMIEWVGVLPECRGLGLGEAVVRACLNWLKAREVTRAVLLTQPFRVPAVRLYEKLGFLTFAAWHKYVRQTMGNSERGTGNG